METHVPAFREERKFQKIICKRANQYKGYTMKIMFYAPHSAIWSHAFPEALVAEALMQRGNKIIYVGCGKQFKSYCVAMSAAGLSYYSTEKEKLNICQKCENNKSIIRKEFGLKGSDIADELSIKDNQIIATILNEATPTNYLNLEFSGICVGRLALYEFLLNHKKNTLEISLDEWPAYKSALENTISSALVSLKIIEREKPDRLITYNSFYSVNHACCIAADKFSVMHYMLHAGSNMSNRMETLTLTKEYSYNYITRSPIWEHYRELPCTSDQFSIVTAHLLSLFEAKSVFVYSTPISKKKSDLKQKFGVALEQRVLVATMSSHDERFAAVTIGVMPKESPHLVFATQIDWILALIEFVTQRPDLFLIIRVHPREFPNKRESVTSKYAATLQNALVNLPANVRVNWPWDEVSLYDIADISHLFLNCRSTTGVELCLLGLPVVIYSPSQLYSYPPDLNYVADSKVLYFQQIEHALSHGWDIEFSRMAYRWGVFQYCHTTFKISESYKMDGNNNRGIVARGIGKLRRKLSPLYQQKQNCRDRAQRLKSEKTINDFLISGKDSIAELNLEKSEVTLDQETNALKCEFRKIYAALYRNRSNIEPGSLQEKIATFIGQENI